MNARVPRYHRIAESLRDRIHGGRLMPGTRLDNQRALAKSFGVTLMTLRQALELLERENLIARRHGLGTFVAAPSIDYDILQLRRFESHAVPGLHARDDPRWIEERGGEERRTGARTAADDEVVGARRFERVIESRGVEGQIVQETFPPPAPGREPGRSLAESRPEHVGAHLRPRR